MGDEMNVIDPASREAFRNEEIRAIERAVRSEYEALIKAVSCREERKRCKAAMKAEIQKRIAGLLDARRKDDDYCL